MKATRPLRRLTLFVAGVVVFCVFFEVLALVIYYYQTGHLFYAFRHTYETIPETENRTLTRVGLHPYFGPTHKKGIPFEVPSSLQKPGATHDAHVETNNFGFASRYDYPFLKTREDQFVIGLFGGSVGLWFCQVGAPRLIEDLKRHDYFRNRDLVPLCFSHEGYKQPQQLLVLAYFLSIGQPFDLVVNIDGFNEVALSNVNHQRGMDISMPSWVHVEPLINLVNQSTLTPAKLQSLARIGGYKERLNSLAARINANRIASVHFVLDQFHRILSRQYQAELVTLAALPSIASEHSLIHVTRPTRGRDAATLFVDIAKEWLSSSRLMQELLEARSTPYFHILQPNQYFTTRPFSEAEAAVALSNESPFKEGVVKGYPLLVEVSAPSGRAVNIFDATHVFDRETSPVYMDNCCHYTLKGNEILADFIADRIVRSTGSWSAR